MNGTTRIATCSVVQAVLLTLLAANAVGQVPEEALTILKHRVGHWKVRNDVLDVDGSVTRVTHEEHDARFVINGEIVEIHGHIEGHEDFRAFILFNPAIGKYIYTTTDRSNNHVDMSAEAQTPYHFTSHAISTPNGPIIFRLVFETVEADRMEGYGEVSYDGGTTWRRVYNQVLRRVGQPEGR